MISFIVRMRFEPADHADVSADLSALTVASRQEKGCVSYIAHFLEDDPNTVVIYEQYVGQNALDHHRSSPHFAKHAIGGLFQKMRDRERESLIAVC